MLHVLESPSGPPTTKEYFYNETIQVKNHIALVVSEGAKSYLFHLGYRYLGDIESEDKLEEFLKNRDLSAMPGDADDNIDDKPFPKPVHQVKTETIRVKNRPKETEPDNSELPATEGPVERWWDRPE